MVTVRLHTVKSASIPHEPPHRVSPITDESPNTSLLGGNDLVTGHLPV